MGEVKINGHLNDQARADLSKTLGCNLRFTENDGATIIFQQQMAHSRLTLILEELGLFSIEPVK
jgi:hypothetical protein